MVNKTSKIFLSLVAIAALAYFLALVLSGHLILPQYFSIGALKIHYYGIILALAAAAGYFLAVARAPRFGLKREQAEDIIFWIIIGGFIGARLYHVASSFDYYKLHPLDIIKVWNGGLSIYGAVIGGFLALLILKKIFNFQFSIFKILDWLTPSLLLGQIIGRFGNFFNYELYGYPTNLPWKMFVPAAFRYPGYGQYSFFHPLFLYEALGNAIILGALLIFEFRQKGKNQSSFKIFSGDGSLFFFYLLLYNLLRFFLEFLRIDSVFIGHFRQNAIVSLLLVLIAAGFLTFRYAKIP